MACGGPIPEDFGVRSIPGTERGSDAYRRILIALFLVGFATFSLLHCVQPLLPLFSQIFQISAAESSLALSATTGLLAVSILFAGALSENRDRKKVMIASLCGAATLNLLAGAAPGWHSLLVLRALEGIVLGGVPAVAMAYLAEEIAPNGLGLAMGLYIGGSAVGGMSGRVMAGFLAEFTSWRIALGAVGLMGLISALGSVLLLPSSSAKPPQMEISGHGQQLAAFVRHLRTPGLPWLFLIGFLVMGAFTTVYNYSGFRLMAPPYSLSQGTVGLIFVVYLVGTVSSSAAGALADRIGRGPVLIAGVLITGSGIAATLLPSIPAIVGGIALVTIGFFAAHSIASGWVGGMARGAKGHASALYLLSYYLGASVIGSLTGHAWTSGGWPAIAAIVSALLALALIAALRIRRLDSASGSAADGTG